MIRVLARVVDFIDREIDLLLLIVIRRKLTCMGALAKYVFDSVVFYDVGYFLLRNNVKTPLMPPSRSALSSSRRP